LWLQRRFPTRSRCDPDNVDSTPRDEQVGHASQCECVVTWGTALIRSGYARSAENSRSFDRHVSRPADEIRLAARSRKRPGNLASTAKDSHTMRRMSSTDPVHDMNASTTFPGPLGSANRPPMDCALGQVCFSGRQHPLQAWNLHSGHLRARVERLPRRHPATSVVDGRADRYVVDDVGGVVTARSAGVRPEDAMTAVRKVSASQACHDSRAKYNRRLQRVVAAKQSGRARIPCRCRLRGDTYALAGFASPRADGLACVRGTALFVISDRVLGASSVQIRSAAVWEFCCGALWLMMCSLGDRRQRQFVVTSQHRRTRIRVFAPRAHLLCADGTTLDDPNSSGSDGLALRFLAGSLSRKRLVYPLVLQGSGDGHRLAWFFVGSASGYKGRPSAHGGTSENRCSSRFATSLLATGLPLSRAAG